MIFWILLLALPAAAGFSLGRYGKSLTVGLLISSMLPLLVGVPAWLLYRSGMNSGSEEARDWTNPLKSVALYALAWELCGVVALFIGRSAQRPEDRPPAPPIA